jgi:uncharacterized protein (DUF1684 family)
MSTLENHRQAKDDFFADHPQSPLTSDQKRLFSGLRYYPENSALSFETALEPFEEKQTVQMQTNTGEVQAYIRYGKIHFVVDGQPAELTVFANEHGLFMPFVDSRAGEETYGAGRYLEPDVLPSGKVWVDFNMAYNPYCAYNERWSCPLPPGENRLSLPIEAGEKIFNQADLGLQKA